MWDFPTYDGLEVHVNKSLLVGAVLGAVGVLKPYDTAETINSKGLNAPVLAWLTDPMDLQFLQIQGSGRIQLDNGRQLRIGYADQNGHPYKPIGRWLVEQGELKKEDVTMGTIHAWAMAAKLGLFRSQPTSGNPAAFISISLSAI